MTPLCDFSIFISSQLIYYISRKIKNGKNDIIAFHWEHVGAEYWWNSLETYMYLILAVYWTNTIQKLLSLQLQGAFSVLSLYFFSIFYYSNMFSFRLFCTQQLLCQHYFLMVVQVTSNRSSDSSRQFFTLSKKSAKMPHPNSYVLAI